ncbi:MAG: LysR family transcriptional regulator [Gammaproteobacteria bacterium]|nr:LysR family transcriptional regulator [Gammaproteobacteria bacterium]
MADRRLQVFYTVARLLSFTKAAEALHMTQPAVTFQVRQMEEYFTARLFDRTHNRIRLTEAGKRAYEYAQRIFGLYEEMEHAVRELTGEVSGVLLIGASTTVAEYLLPPLLGHFKREYPDVQIRLKVSNTEGIVGLVENNLVDLGFIEGTVENSSFSVQICHDEELVVVVPPGHALAGHAGVAPSELTGYPWICREEGSGTREIIAHYLQDNGMHYADLNVVMELGSPEAIKGAVEADMGISVMPSATIAKELKLGTLRSVPLAPALKHPLSFIYKKQKFHVRALDELLTFAYQYCRGAMPA